ncbi:hypothetical protein [Microviridae sp.]|nr:hypothetical protein [Microviridae sp.]
MDPITGNALLAAGSKILGGVLGSRGPSLRKQSNVQRNSQLKYERQSFNQSMDQQKKRFQTLVKSAESAGFNPSTALAAGGLAGGGNAQMSMGQPQTPFNLGQALGDALGTYADRMDPIALETAELNNEIARQTLENLQNKAINPYGAVQTVSETEGKGAQIGETGFGDPITEDAVRQEAIDARNKDSGFFSAYKYIDAPPWWPSAGYMEETFGDDSFVTNTHKTMTPWVVGANNYGEITTDYADQRREKKTAKAANRAREQYARSRRPSLRGTPELQQHMLQHFPTVFD